MRQRAWGDFTCPGVVKLLSHRTGADFPDLFWFSTNKSLYIRLSATDPFRLQQLLFDFANWLINLFSDWFPDSFPDPLTDSSTSCLEVKPCWRGVLETFTHSAGQSIFQHAAHRKYKILIKVQCWKNWKQTLWFIMPLDLPSGIICDSFPFSCCYCGLWHHASCRSKGGCFHLLEEGWTTAQH